VFSMRTMYVFVLWADGKTSWMTVPWGKTGFDYIRKLGGTILESHE